MTELIHHPDFWRWAVGIAVVIFALSGVMQALDTFWYRPKTSLRHAQIVGRVTGQHIARYLRDRDAEPPVKEWDLYDERHPANALRNDTTMAARMTKPGDIVRIGDEEKVGQEPAGALQGPQERPMGPPATDEAEDGPDPRTEALSASIPRFGEPKVLFYVPEDFEEPLRCSVPDGACGGRELTRHEGYYEIPDPSRADGAFLVVCTDDARRIVMEPDL